MAEGRTGLTAYHPDGSVGVTIDGRRLTLRVPDLGELEDLRYLFRDLAAEREDWLDLVYRPGLTALKAEVKASRDPDERKGIRKRLMDLESDQDHRAQDAWATWWRAALDLLCRDDLAVPDGRPAEGLPVWMVESMDSIPVLFKHWRSTPSEGSGGNELATALQSLADLNG